MTASADIEVVDVRAGGGNVKAIVGVRIGPVVVHGFRVVQMHGQPEWISLPQAERLDRAGRTLYRPAVEIDEPLRTQVEAAVLDAWRSWGPGDAAA